MRFLKWLLGRQSARSADNVQMAPDTLAWHMAETLKEWTSASSLAETRESFGIPGSARNFECEMLYLYVFLSCHSFLHALPGHGELAVQVARLYMDHVGSAIDDGEFQHLPLDWDVLQQRYQGYADLATRGREYLTEQLPYQFLVTNEVCPSDNLEDADVTAKPLMTMQVWIPSFLLSLVEAHQKWKLIDSPQDLPR